MAKAATYNISTYKAFRSKLSRVTDLKNRVSQGKLSTKQKLLNRNTQKTNQPTKPPVKSKATAKNQADLKALDKKYKKQLGNLEKGFSKRIKSLADKNTSLSKSLDKGFKGTNKGFSELADRVQSILATRENPNKKTTGVIDTNATTTELSVLDTIDLEASLTNPYDIKIDESKEDVDTEKINEKVNKEVEEIETEKNIGGTVLNGYTFLDPSETDIITQAASNKNLKADIGTIVPVGDYTYNIRNLHGPRTGKNAVLGRKGHSKGVDLVSYKDGKKVNYPISVADGVIIHIGKDGSGKAIKTTQGKAAGYMVYVQLKEDPTKVIGYWHLGQSVYDNRASLKGAIIRRGDVIVKDSSFTGSGTGAHTKIVMASYDPKTRKIINDYADNDPTNIILTGNISI